MACDCNRVGCAENYTAYIAAAGKPDQPLGEIPAWTEIQWARRKCGTSDARIVTAPDDPSSCCDLMGAVEGGVYPWRHELVIVRETDDCHSRVWHGPIDLVGGDFAHAVDPSAWLGHFPVSIIDAAPPDLAVAIAFQIVTQAIASSGANPAVPGPAIVSSTGETVEMEVNPEDCAKGLELLSRLCSENKIEWWFEDGEIKIAPAGYAGENIGIIEDEHLASIPTVELDGTDGPPLSEGGFDVTPLCENEKPPEVSVNLDDLAFDPDAPICLDNAYPTDVITMRLGGACQNIDRDVRLCDIRVSVNVGPDGVSENVQATFETVTP